jgi:hypothetical protein
MVSAKRRDAKFAEKSAELEGLVLINPDSEGAGVIGRNLATDYTDYRVHLTGFKAVSTIP